MYYTLMASLPHLSAFDKVRELPISWIQLQKRRTLLDEDDRALIAQIQKLLAWYYHPSTIRSRHIVEMYQTILAKTHMYPKIQKIIREIMEQRTLVAAFRMKYIGISKKDIQSDWGVGSDKEMIERLWDADDFKLSIKYPWVKQIKNCFEEDKPYELTKLLMELIYKKAEKLKFENPFSLDAYVAYLIQWAIMQKWLTYVSKKAAIRFDNLISEATREYKQYL